MEGYVMEGYVIGIIGAVLAVIVSGIGSAIAVYRAGVLAGGFLSKGQGKFGNMLILQLLPATQGLYGFIVAFMAFVNMGVLAGDTKAMAAITVGKGIAILIACLPVTVVGIFSAIFQGKVVMTGMEMCVKQDKQMVRAMLMAAMVEIFAIFSLVVSLLGVMGLTA